MWKPLFVFLVLAGCTPVPPPDTQPPQLVSTQVSPADQQLKLEFDEPLATAKTDGDFGKTAPRGTVEGKQVVVELPSALVPGKSYHWAARVEDPNRNVTSVAGRFYGPNDHPARLRLNEVRIVGAGIHTDFVELRVEAPGSLGGWTLDAYTSAEARVRLVLPDRTVARGDFVVIHCKATGSSGEHDEVTAPDQSAGADSDPSAWDFWVPHGKGLSAVKGVLVLRPSPHEAPIDALVYSQKPGEALAIAAALGWSTTDELDPASCTATRTWSRTEGPDARWMVTTNGGATPGKPNKTTPWAGTTSNQKRAPKSKGRRRRSAASGPGLRSGPGAKQDEGAGVSPAGPVLPKESVRREKNGNARSAPSRPGLRLRGAPLPKPRSPTPRGLGGPGKVRRRPGEEEGQQSRTGRSPIPRFPGNAPSANPHQEATRP